MKSRDFYWLITNKTVIKATGPRKWEYKTQLMNLNWPCYFSNLKTICKETKLIEFYYKFLHRIITTKKELYHFDIESNNDCLYCNESDSIVHTFIDCYLSKSFFSHVLEWFNTKHATSYSLSSKEVLFGKLDNCQLARSEGTLRKLNYCLLFAKYYLYCQKLNKKQINFDKFK